MPVLFLPSIQRGLLLKKKEFAPLLKKRICSLKEQILFFKSRPHFGMLVNPVHQSCSTAKMEEKHAELQIRKGIKDSPR